MVLKLTRAQKKMGGETHTMCDAERDWVERMECIRDHRWQLTTAGR